MKMPATKESLIMKEQADLEAGADLFFTRDRSQSELRILPPLTNYKFANCAVRANPTVDFASDTTARMGNQNRII